MTLTQDDIKSLLGKYKVAKAQLAVLNLHRESGNTKGLELLEDNEPIAQQIVTVFERAMAKLSLEQQEVIELRYLKELTFREISQEVGKGKTKVKRLVSDAIEILARNSISTD